MWANPYTFTILICNALHFTPEALDWIGLQLGHNFTVENVNMLGKIAYEYFLGAALIGLIGMFVPNSRFGKLIQVENIQQNNWDESKESKGLREWMIIIMLILPWLWLTLE